MDSITVNKSTINKLLIKSKNLDPISVFIEEFEGNKADITITCWFSSWTYFWGAMGCKFKEFFLSADNYYLAKKFLNGKTSETDYEEFINQYKKKILKLRYKGDLEQQEARVLYDKSDIILDDLQAGDRWGNSEDLSRVMCDEWWMDIPTKYTHEHKYLFEILDVIKRALKGNPELLEGEL
ncbi:MAG: hypothetical protein HRU26_06910 [Psychroserpens sp.]|nr:hypothetical protein [Psychroserpens sp.]